MADLLPSSKILPSPTAITSHFLGFSLLSGRMIPDLVVFSSFMGLINT
jgi:hypothetical protein